MLAAPEAAMEVQVLLPTAAQILILISGIHPAKRMLWLPGLVPGLIR